LILFYERLKNQGEQVRIQGEHIQIQIKQRVDERFNSAINLLTTIIEVMNNPT
jgi:hypothetical protein